jgi:hypothetical protein
VDITIHWTKCTQLNTSWDVLMQTQVTSTWSISWRFRVQQNASFRPETSISFNTSSWFVIIWLGKLGSICLYFHWFFNCVADEFQFVIKILWTDEATFTHSDTTNVHNILLLASQESPRNNTRISSTEHRGLVVNTPASYSVQGSNHRPETGYLVWAFCGFPQSLQANAGIAW